MLVFLSLGSSSLITAKVQSAFDLESGQLAEAATL
jgi:hypothetical protein